MVYVAVAEDDPVVSLRVVVAGLVPWHVVGNEEVVFNGPGSDSLVERKTHNATEEGFPTYFCFMFDESCSTDRLTRTIAAYIPDQPSVSPPTLIKFD